MNSAGGLLNEFRAPSHRFVTAFHLPGLPWPGYQGPMKAKALIAAMALASWAEGSTILHTVDPQLYRDEALLYPSVGKVTGSGLSGSGVLLSDRWVLTAGHIARGKTGNTFSIGGTNYTIESTILHPDYRFPQNPFDLGLVRLSTPVSGVAAATMLQLDSPNSVLGREATWVGHGLSGTGLTGQSGGLDFRAFTNIIDVVGTAYGLTETSFVSDFDNPDGTINAPSSAAGPTRLEGNVTSGDSGGGVFITVDGVPYLIGINSYTGRFGPGAASSYGSISGATNLNLFYSWIFEQTGISAVPEPGVLWLFCLGSLICLRRRR